VEHKLEVLRGHCETVGRDPAEIEKTMIASADPLADPDAFVSAMEGYAALGIEKVWASAVADDPAAWVTEVCETVRPRLAELGS
jgi:hypothetical protein